MRDEGRSTGQMPRIKPVRTVNDQKTRHHLRVNDLYDGQRHHATYRSAFPAEGSASDPERLRINIRRRKYREHRISMFFSLFVTILIVTAIVFALFRGFIN
jgi:hypothetical protein